MGRLTQLRPRLGSMPRRVGGSLPATEAERSRLRDALAPSRAWYKTARWQRLRWDVLVRDLFTCRLCGRIEGVTSRLVADHIVPHRGDAGRFWDAGNLQCLCKACHDGTKQAQERRARR